MGSAAPSDSISATVIQQFCKVRRSFSRRDVLSKLARTWGGVRPHRGFTENFTAPGGPHLGHHHLPPIPRCRHHAPGAYRPRCVTDFFIREKAEKLVPAPLPARAVSETRRVCSCWQGCRHELYCVPTAPARAGGVKGRRGPHLGFSRLSARPQVRRTWGITGAGAAPHVGITVMPR